MTDRRGFAVDAAAGRTGTAVQECGRGPRRLGGGAGLRFTRHLLEMMGAMGVGMAVFGVGILLFGSPHAFDNLLVEYGAMGVAMAVPMVAWMRHRGHSWADGGEMTAAMLVPMFALVLPAELDVPGLSGHTVMMLSHVAMIGGMVALMVYRWDRYTQRAHDHRP